MKYVVLSNLVCGQFTRGQVVSGEQLGNDLTRCLNLGSVRKATREESGEARVTFADQPERHTLESRLADQDEEIARLRASAAALQDQLTALTSAAAAEAETGSHQRNRAAERAQAKLKTRIADLEGEAAVKDERIGELEQRVAELEEALTAPADAPSDEVE